VDPRDPDAHPGQGGGAWRGVVGQLADDFANVPGSFVAVSASGKTPPSVPTVPPSGSRFWRTPPVTVCRCRQLRGSRFSLPSHKCWEASSAVGRSCASLVRSHKIIVLHCLDMESNAELIVKSTTHCKVLDRVSFKFWPSKGHLPGEAEEEKAAGTKNVNLGAIGLTLQQLGCCIARRATLPPHLLQVAKLACNAKV